MADPDVPDVPGVPQVSRNRLASDVEEQPVELTNDTVTNFGKSPAPTWGLFSKNVSVVTAESVVAMEYRQDWTVSNYQVENGAFQSYDKVNSPFDGRIRFASGGSEKTRQALLDTIGNISGKTSPLYDLATPEKIWRSVTVYHYDFHRESNNGVGLLVIDVWCQEIREAGAQAFSQTKAPSGADPENNGTVQATDPTPAQTQELQPVF